MISVQGPLTRRRHFPEPMNEDDMAETGTICSYLPWELGFTVLSFLAEELNVWNP